MNTKQSIQTRLAAVGVIPIIRIDNAEKALRIAEAILRGGIPCLEVTLTTPGALGVIGGLASEYGGQFLIGAGTVLDAESARAAIDAGATFIVSPNTRRETLELCRRHGVVSCPGALTPTEIVTAWEQGGDLIKVFPVDNMGGARYIRAPTGGIDLGNVAEHITAGATAVAVGSSLMDRKLIEAGDWAGIATQAARFVAAVAQARG